MRHERIGASVPNVDRFVDQVVGLRGLLGNGVDGVLEDLALAASHDRMLRRPREGTHRAQTARSNLGNESFACTRNVWLHRPLLARPRSLKTNLSPPSVQVLSK